MYWWLLIAVVSAIILFRMFLPDLLPRCACCGKLKPRFFIRIHKPVSLHPGYRGTRSVCVRCCRKYDIESLADLERVNRIRRRLKLRILAGGKPGDGEQ